MLVLGELFASWSLTRLNLRSRPFLDADTYSPFFLGFRLPLQPRQRFVGGRSNFPASRIDDWGSQVELHHVASWFVLPALFPRIHGYVSHRLTLSVFCPLSAPAHQETQTTSSFVASNSSSPSSSPSPFFLPSLSSVNDSQTKLTSTMPQLSRVSPKDSHLRPIHRLGHLAHRFWISSMFVLSTSLPSHLPSPPGRHLLISIYPLRPHQRPSPPLDPPSNLPTDPSPPSQLSLRKRRRSRPDPPLDGKRRGWDSKTTPTGPLKDTEAWRGGSEEGGSRVALVCLLCFLFDLFSALFFWVSSLPTSLTPLFTIFSVIYVVLPFFSFSLLFVQSRRSSCFPVRFLSRSRCLPSLLYISSLSSFRSIHVPFSPLCFLFSSPFSSLLPRPVPSIVSFPFRFVHFLTNSPVASLFALGDLCTCFP